MFSSITKMFCAVRTLHELRLLANISIYKCPGVSEMQCIVNDNKSVNPASSKFTMTTHMPTQTRQWHFVTTCSILQVRQPPCSLYMAPCDVLYYLNIRNLERQNWCCRNTWTQSKGEVLVIPKTEHERWIQHLQERWNKSL
jgi:hypothetical protein